MTTNTPNEWGTSPTRVTVNTSNGPIDRSSPGGNSYAPYRWWKIAFFIVAGISVFFALGGLMEISEGDPVVGIVTLVGATIIGALTLFFGLCADVLNRVWKKGLFD